MKLTETNIISGEYACTLVGYFMNMWAITERAVDGAIGDALDLDLPQSLLIASTLSMYQKINLLRTLTNLSNMKEDEKRKFAKIMNDMRELSEHRNTVAHCPFKPTEDNTRVKFLRVKSNAKGLDVPDIRWTRKDFLVHGQSLMDLGTELELLGEKLRQARNYQKLAEAMAGIRSIQPT